MPIKIKRDERGTGYVVRRRGKRVYAAAFSSDLSDRQIESQIRQGDAAFFPYNERTGKFNWSAADAGKPRHFKR